MSLFIYIWLYACANIYHMGPVGDHGQRGECKSQVKVALVSTYIVHMEFECIYYIFGIASVRFLFSTSFCSLHMVSSCTHTTIASTSMPGSTILALRR